MTITFELPVEIEMPALNSTPKQFISWLASFRSADQLAEWFRLHGITGQLGSSSWCPIANVAKIAMPGPDIEVGLDRIMAYAGTDLVASVKLPRKATRFINWFDMGHYPDLIG